mmetsp:Transcript_15673/g.51427  ORF Transcript_15673/g.51427 Transcript_15673/m.51427 type:complete len:213 (-) Transcript_15673:444-1082(-)
MRSAQGPNKSEAGLSPRRLLRSECCCCRCCCCCAAAAACTEWMRFVLPMRSLRLRLSASSSRSSRTRFVRFPSCEKSGAPALTVAASPAPSSSLVVADGGRRTTRTLPPATYLCTMSTRGGSCSGSLCHASALASSAGPCGFGRVTDESMRRRSTSAAAPEVAEGLCSSCLSVAASGRVTSLARLRKSVVADLESTAASPRSGRVITLSFRP